MRRHIRQLQLTSTEVAELQAHYQAAPNQKRAARYQCILLKGQGLTHTSIAQVLCVHINTVSEWLQVYQEADIAGLDQWDNHGDPGSLSTEQLAHLTTQVTEQQPSRAEDVQTYIRDHFTTQYSVRGVQALLHRLKFSFRKLKLIPGKADAQRQREFVMWYEKLRCELGPTDVVFFIDGVHPLHNALAGYAWLPKGTIVYLRSNTGRKRVNILGALNPITLEYVDIQTQDSITATTVVDLLTQLQQQHPEAQRIVVILDNARYNYAKVVRTTFADTPVELVYLPPYSPNLNLIERLWRFFCGKVLRNHYYEQFDQFKEAIRDFFAQLADYHTELRALITENFTILECA